MRSTSNNRLLAVMLLGVTVSTSAVAQQATDLGLPSIAEYPEQDRQIWTFHRKGLAATLAAEGLAREPDSAKTAALLFEAQRFADGLRVVQAVARVRVEQLPRALEALASVASNMRTNDARNYADAIRAVVTDARSRLDDLPREAAASAARWLLQIEGQFPSAPGRDWKAAQAEFVREYAGTDAVRLVEVDLATRRMLDGRKSGEPLDTEPLDTFLQQHPGTVAAAKALFEKALHLGGTGAERRGGDPTERLIRVRAIVAELTSGRYPRSEWVERAPSVISWFRGNEPVYAPGNAERALDILLETVRTYLTLEEPAGTNNRVDYILTSRIPELIRVRGGGLTEIEQAFAALESHAPIAEAVRYVRAMFYQRQMRETRDASERPVLYQKAQDSFRTALEGGSRPTQRKALAALAALQFAERDYAKARDHFRKYADTYPESEWAWVAALRVGQCEMALSNWKGAIPAFTAAATRFSSVPPARVLGHVHRGWALEAEGNFDSALLEYQAATRAWDPHYGSTYSTYVMRVPAAHEPFGILDESRVNRQELAERTANLDAMLRRPGGGMLERGLWLLRRGKRDEAIGVLRDVTARFAKSSVAADARAAAQRARLDAALELADVERATRNEAAAIKELELLSEEPFSFAVCAAKITRAAILLRRGVHGDAEALMKEALEQLRAHQKTLLSPPQPGSVGRDAVAIRDAIFRRAGDAAIYDKGTFMIATPARPFLILRSRLNVRLADGEDILVPALSPLPGIDNALFLERHELAFFDSLLARLGGTRRAAGPSIMAIPQPVGAAVDLLAFLNRFFAAQPGHWGGWLFETFPNIYSVEFTNPERTKAAARVRVGYQGTTILLEKEKEQDRWMPKGRTGDWIE